MTPESKAQHWEHRLAITARFIERPEAFKVCDVCLAISRKHAPVCQVCAAYRFRERPAQVRRIARIMATVPWPRSAGVVPRLATHCAPPHIITPGVSVQKKCQREPSNANS